MRHAIVVDRLSKRYLIGATPRDTMLRDRIVNLARGRWNRRASTAPMWALRDISLTVREGETVGIIGRNGAGKSTLLKVLSKITHPTSGRFTTRGRVASLLEVGTGFHDELTGRDNVFLNGSIMGMKKREVDASFDQIVAYAGVERFIDTPVKHYSSGMRLRLGFAVAAHLSPDILIVDEVHAVGDAGFQNKCMRTLEALRSDGRTVLFVSHNMAALESLCTRAVWLDEGELREDGAAGPVIRSYLSAIGENGQRSDLRANERRSGDGRVRFTNVEWLSIDRAPQTITRTGEAVVLRLCYHAKADVPQASVGFRLFSESGALAISASTWQNGIAIPVIPAGHGHIDVLLSCVNLTPGRYSLTLWLTDGPYGSFVYDEIEHCAYIDIAPGRPEWGGNIDSRYGLVYLPRQWDLSGVAQMASIDAAPAV